MMAYANYYEIGLSKEMADELKTIEGCGDLQTFLNRIDMSKYTNILKHGDVIGLLNYPGYGYRNDGKVMWDDEHRRLVDLDYDDEYGNVPSKFIVGKEFDNAFYWQQSIEQKTFMDSNMTITHNYYIYASFDKNLVSNITQDGHFFTFDYARGKGVTEVEVWKIFTNNLNQYFKHKPVLSASYSHLEHVFEHDFDISKDVNVSRCIIDITYAHILQENDYDLSRCDFIVDESDDDDDEVGDKGDDYDPKGSPIIFRDANDKTKSSQYIINCIDNDLDEIVSQPFESSYSFVDYKTLSVWTWKRFENNYTIELVNNSEDLSKFNNLEIATIYEHYTWRQSNTPKLKYSYTWNNMISTNFVLTFNNSLKFLVKKHGLISSHQVTSP